MKSIPEECALVKKFAGRPFSLVGVNVGEGDGDVASKEKKYAINYRSFCSREKGGVPKVASDLDLDGAGIAILVDSRGIIRFRGPAISLKSRYELDKEISALVAAAE